MTQSSECKVWFDGVSKQRKEDLKISKHIKTRDRNEAKRPKIFQEAGLLGDEETTENLQSDSEETSISAFKRIRFESGLQAEAAAALPVTTPVPPPAAADASKAAPPSKEKDKPIRFRDGIGRRFSFPFDICKTWSVCYSSIGPNS